MLGQASALERVLRPMEKDLPAELATYLLKLDFPPEDHARCEDLSYKAQRGELTETERTELEDLIVANNVLTILQSKARASLRRQNPAA